MTDYLKTREKMVQLLTDYFKKKSSVYSIEMVFLYGSWAVGYPRQDSDIDLAILFSSHIENEDSLFELMNNTAYELSKETSKEISLTLLTPPKVIFEETLNTYLEELAVEFLLDHRTTGIIFRMYIRPIRARNQNRGGKYYGYNFNLFRCL